MPNTAKLLELCRHEFDTKDWTYDALSEKSSVARSTVVNYITDKVETPKRHIVESLCRALSIDPDAPEAKEEISVTVLTHCDRCRAAQNDHNRILREDFNDRHKAMRESYEAHINSVEKHYEARIADMEKFYDQRHAMHEAEKRDMRLRNRILLSVCIALGAVISAALIIDLLHGSVGWFRYWAGSNHGILDEVMRYIAGWLV